MEEGKDLLKQITRSRGFGMVCNPPAPKGERPNGSFTQWSVTPFGFGRNFAGFENGCVLIRKKFMVWALVGTGGPAPCRWALPDR